MLWDVRRMSLEPRNAAARKPKQRKRCWWKRNDGFDYYDAACGQQVGYFESDWLPRGYRFCPYCGGRIVIQKKKI